MSLCKFLASAAIAAAFTIPVSAYSQAAPAPSMNAIVAQAIMNPDPTAATTHAAPTAAATQVDAQVQEIPHAAPVQADPVGAPSAAVSTTVTNGPVPDNAANRAKYGGPMSHKGRASAAAGN